MRFELETFAGSIPAADACESLSPTVPAPWLSVLVPIYNVQPFLEECILSILEQLEGQSGIELILLNDKSTDGSDDLCRRIIAGGGNARLLDHAENRGISAARNTLIEAASGDYVWFIDGDDKLLPGAIIALQAIIVAHQPDAVLCDYVRESGKSYASFSGPQRCVIQCTETLVAGTFVMRQLHVWSRIWRRDLFEETIRFPVGACFEDVAIVPRLLLKAETFYYSAEPWIYYRSRPGSIMSRINDARRAFDIRRNDDMARALLGFSHELTHTIPQVAPETHALLARFLTREFVKIAKRRARGLWRDITWAELRAEIWRYRGSMEACSPIPFTAIAWQHLRKGSLERAFALGIVLAVGRPTRSTRS